MASALERVKKEALGFYRRYQDNEVSTRASALAFHTLLAIVPIVGMLFWYLSRLSITDVWLDQTKQYILSQLNINSSAVFAKHFDRLTRMVHGSSWGWVGFAILAYSAWNLIARFGDSLDHILGAKERAPHDIFGYGWLLLRRLVVMLGLPVALVVSIVLSQWIRRDSWLHYLFDIKFFGPYFALPLAWVGSIVSVYLVYHFIPRTRVPAVQALKAALVVGPASETIRYFFGLYNGYAVSVHKIYGVLAVIPMFIMWVQVAWILLLSGALLIRLGPGTQQVSKRRRATF